MLKRVRTIFGSAFGLLALLTAASVVLDRVMDNPAQRSASDHKT